MHSSEHMVREAKIKISHLLFFSTASALREEVNAVSPALYLPVLEPEDRKIRLLNNRREKKFSFSFVHDVKIPTTCIYLTVQPDPL